MCAADHREGNSRRPKPLALLIAVLEGGEVSEDTFAKGVTELQIDGGGLRLLTA